ncbi:MAG: dihydrolipoyllysine-residue acetyltransferase [Pseudomonadota bacterium]
MIKFLELTAPESDEFRQAKIISVEIAEGDRIDVGDTMFVVKSGNKEIDLPATRAGKVTELIALAGQNISVMTPLILLETEVESSTATPPINVDVNEQDEAADEGDLSKDDKSSATKKKTKAKKSKAGGKKKKRSKKKASKKEKKVSARKLSDADQSEQADSSQEQQNLDLTVQASQTTSDEQTAASETAQNSNAETSQNQTSISMSKIQVSVPDIGSDAAKVIEILVKVGDEISVDDPIITLESDKASMDVPSTHAGKVNSIAIAVDQDLSEGDLILELETADASPSAEADTEATTDSGSDAIANAAMAAAQAAAPSSSSSTSSIDVVIPDIGGDSAKVIEILVKAGDTVAVEDPLVTLESDKASMDVPSSAAGVIQSIEVSIDQDVSEGVVVVKLAAAGGDSTAAAVVESPAPVTAAAPAPTEPKPATPIQAAPTQPAPAGKAHASPSIRRFARELGVDLTKVSGTGRKGRIKKEDVKQFVKGVLTSSTPAPAAQATSGAGIPEVPAVDFSKFGEIDIQPLNRIKRLTASNLHRSWLNVPHVTHNDESNISDLESFRKQLNAEYAKQEKNIKLSPLAFIVKAVVNALQAYPQFNSSLEPGGENLIYKKYFNIGIAVETPNGLVVPVVKDADKKNVAEIAQEMGDLAAKARNKKLTTQDMTGACFTISSLGGIGGTHFTPIVNAPEVAILGVSRSKMQPVWDGAEFKPGMILPLSLSYDHRVIDGAEAARFTRHVAAVLEDVRRLTV